MPGPDDRFDQIISEGYSVNRDEAIDENPYGAPAHTVKPGLTKRGKAALAIGATVIAGGSLISWTHYSAQSSANETKAQELQLKQQQLELEKLKELNRISADKEKTQASVNKTVQKQIDACVNDNKGLVGKQLGATYRSVLEDCQAQYSATTSTDQMDTAASVSDSSGSGGAGVNQGLLIGGGALAVFLVLAAKKGARSNPA
jgi:hypothetical protein